MPVWWWMGNALPVPTEILIVTASPYRLSILLLSVPVAEVWAGWTAVDYCRWDPKVPVHCRGPCVMTEMEKCRRVRMRIWFWVILTPIFLPVENINSIRKKPKRLWKKHWRIHLVYPLRKQLPECIALLI